MTQLHTTQRERLASLESYVDGHAREHELTERLWEAKLDAIDARLAQIERMLIEGRDPPSEGGPKLRLARRDLGLAGLAATLTSALWWLAQFFQAMAARGG